MNHPTKLYPVLLASGNSPYVPLYSTSLVLGLTLPPFALKVTVYFFALYFGYNLILPSSGNFSFSPNSSVKSSSLYQPSKSYPSLSGLGKVSIVGLDKSTSTSFSSPSTSITIVVFLASHFATKVTSPANVNFVALVISVSFKYQPKNLYPSLVGVSKSP